MHQVALELDHDDRPNPVMEPGREQQLIASMAQALMEALHQKKGRIISPLCYGALLYLYFLISPLSIHAKQEFISFFTIGY